MKRVAEGILMRDGQILLGLRAAHKRHYPNCWSFPGGHVESFETVEDALVRELREEIGIEVQSFYFFQSFDDPAHAITFDLFVVESWQGAVCNLGDEHSDLRWVPLVDAGMMPGLASDWYHEIFEKLKARSNANAHIADQDVQS